MLPRMLTNVIIFEASFAILGRRNRAPPCHWNTVVRMEMPWPTPD
jgi:hypothetical protein